MCYDHGEVVQYASLIMEAAKLPMAGGISAKALYNRYAGLVTRDEGIFVGARDDATDRPVGFIVGQIFEDHLGRYLMVDQIVSTVVGVGPELLSTLEKVCKEDDISRLMTIASMAQAKVLAKFANARAVGVLMLKEL